MPLTWHYKRQLKWNPMKWHIFIHRPRCLCCSSLHHHSLSQAVSCFYLWNMKLPSQGNWISVFPNTSFPLTCHVLINGTSLSAQSRCNAGRLQVAFPWSRWCENGGRPSVRRQLISCPGPATVAGFSQESSSEFWETHQHANSCDLTWTWWKLFLSPLSLFLSSSRVTLSDCRGPGSLDLQPSVLTSFWGLTDKKTRRLRDRRHRFSLCRLSVDVYEHMCRVGCVRRGGGGGGGGPMCALLLLDELLTNALGSSFCFDWNMNNCVPPDAMVPEISGALLADKSGDLNKWCRLCAVGRVLSSAATAKSPISIL